MEEPAFIATKTTSRQRSFSCGLTIGLHTQKNKGLRPTILSGPSPDLATGRPLYKHPSTAAPAQKDKRPSSLLARTGASSVTRPKAAASPKPARAGGMGEAETPPTAPPTACGDIAPSEKSPDPAAEKTPGKLSLRAALTPKSPRHFVPSYPAGAVSRRGIPGGFLPQTAPAIKSPGTPALCSRSGATPGIKNKTTALYMQVETGSRRLDETPPTTPPITRSDTTARETKRQKASRTLNYNAPVFIPQLRTQETEGHRIKSSRAALIGSDDTSQLNCRPQTAMLQSSNSHANQGGEDPTTEVSCPFPSAEGIKVTERPPTEKDIDNLMKYFCDHFNKKMDEQSLIIDKFLLSFNPSSTESSDMVTASGTYIKDALTSIAESLDSSSSVFSSRSSSCDYSPSTQDSYASSVNFSDSSMEDLSPGDCDLPHSDLLPMSPDLLESLQRDIDSLKCNLATLEDHRRRNNVKIRGVSESVKPPHLKNYIHNMISKFIPDINEPNIIERVYRIKRPVSLPPDVPRDIIVSFFPTWIRGKLFDLPSEKSFLLSPYGHLTFFRDLSKDTLKKRRDFSPVTRELRRTHFAYSWSPSSTLLVKLLSETVHITSPAEGISFLKQNGLKPSRTSNGPT
ncbi:mucin-3A-like isoform X1 [Ranitomeya imitator]|uniref:mucin-3A-like isoform X1 n=1 Tax=Ranitomeya imitator TaxID=111125 RepID=UPI0037E98FE0